MDIWSYLVYNIQVYFDVRIIVKCINGLSEVCLKICFSYGFDIDRTCQYQDNTSL